MADSVKCVRFLENRSITDEATLKSLNTISLGFHSVPSEQPKYRISLRRLRKKRIHSVLPLIQALL